MFRLFTVLAIFLSLLIDVSWSAENQSWIGIATKNSESPEVKTSKKMPQGKTVELQGVKGPLYVVINFKSHRIIFDRKEVITIFAKEAAKDKDFIRFGKTDLLDILRNNKKRITTIEAEFYEKSALLDHDGEQIFGDSLLSDIIESGKARIFDKVSKRQIKQLNCCTYTVDDLDGGRRFYSSDGRLIFSSLDYVG